MQSQFYVLCVPLILGVVLGDPAPSIEDNLKSLNIAGLPTDLSNVTSQMPTVEDAEKVLRDKCKKNNAGDDAYDNAKQAAERAQECVKGIVDVEQIQKEMDLAKPTGDLDVVFKKYCKQSPEMKNCFSEMTRAYEPCLAEEEIVTKNTVINVTDSLIDFICFKDGDRIALFIAEGGTDCLNSSAPAIKKCIESNFNFKVGDDTPNMDNLPLLLLKAEECDKFSSLQKCVVKEMEKCEESTPANVAESLFNFIRKHTPCHKLTSKKTSLTLTGGAKAVAAAATIVPVAWLTLLLLR